MKATTPTQSVGAQRFNTGTINDNSHLLSIKIEINNCPKVPQARVSEHLFCQKCRIVVKSQTKYIIGRGAKVLMGMCILGFITAPLALIPCCYTGWNDVIHSCPQCKQTIGTKLLLIG